MHGTFVLPAPPRASQRDLLRAMFEAAVAAADPGLCVPPHLPDPPLGRTIVVGAGKASAAMAQALEANWLGPLEGLVVTRYGHAVPCRSIEVVEAAHPVPDAAGEAAARRILGMVQGLTEDDLVIALISGGGSSLLALPAPGIALADKQAVNRALLRSGAPIHEINCVRRQLSAVKGGRLAAAAWPARCHALMISDVPGDDPAAIASGPTVAAPAGAAEARAILARRGVDVPEVVRRHLGAEEGPRPGDARLARTRNIVVARPRASLEAAAALAWQAGITPVILGDAIEGESREVARDMARLARPAQSTSGPCVLLSGGETTVTVRGHGRGGRNVEFLLALALELDGEPGIWATAGDTDGIDGVDEAAGALVAPDTLARAAACGLDARAMLADNDAHSFFERLGDRILTGPTLTNVNDFRAVLIG